MAKSKAYQKHGSVKKITDDSITGIRKKILTEPTNSIGDIAKFSKDMSIDKAIFTANGNSVSSQTATLSTGNKRLDLSFTTDYDPRRITNPSKKLTTQITATLWENGNVQAYRVLTKADTKSLKNSKKQYEETLETWKRMTGQKQIDF